MGNACFKVFLADFIPDDTVGERHNNIGPRCVELPVASEEKTAANEGKSKMGSVLEADSTTPTLAQTQGRSSMAVKIGMVKDSKHRSVRDLLTRRHVKDGPGRASMRDPDALRASSREQGMVAALPSQPAADALGC